MSGRRPANPALNKTLLAEESFTSSPPLSSPNISQLQTKSQVPARRMHKAHQPRISFDTTQPVTRPKSIIQKYNHQKSDIPAVKANIDRTNIRIEMLTLENAFLRQQMELQNDENKNTKVVALENVMMEKKLLVLLKENVASGISTDAIVEEVKNQRLKELLDFYPAVDC